MYHSLFVHSTTDGHLISFHILTLMNKDGINILVYVFCQTWALVSLGVEFLAERRHTFKKLCLIYFWLHWVFAATLRTSLVAKSRGYSLVGSGYSLIVVGFSCCGAWALGRGFQQWWCMGLAALWHVESSWTRDRTCVPSIGQKIFNCWITREVHMFYFSKIYFSPYVLL